MLTALVFKMVWYSSTELVSRMVVGLMLILRGGRVLA